MKSLFNVSSLFSRFRYPVSMPEDIALALGIPFSNHMHFDEFVAKLSCPNLRPKKLLKFMPREIAEQAFQGALRKERYLNKTLVSYYFNEGWLEFILQFDDNCCLRRIYLQHKNIAHDRGLEIILEHTPKAIPYT